MSNTVGIISSPYSLGTNIGLGTPLSIQQQLLVLLKRSLKRADILKLASLLSFDHLSLAKFDLKVRSLLVQVLFYCRKTSLIHCHVYVHLLSICAYLSYLYHNMNLAQLQTYSLVVPVLILLLLGISPLILKGLDATSHQSFERILSVLHRSLLSIYPFLLTVNLCFSLVSMSKGHQSPLVPMHLQSSEHVLQMSLRYAALPLNSNHYAHPCEHHIYLPLY